ncbi:MAG: DUF749 family protein [Thermoplasmata archaeon]|nr:MAG: DUF749 family protein [Thermoplasmata archaeon]
METTGGPGGKYRAVLVSMTKVSSVGEDLMPFVVFRANIEKREPRDDDDVAIFNVHGTSSNFVIFLDPGKTVEELERELEPYNVVISASDWNRLTQDLEVKAQYLEATGEE